MDGLERAKLKDKILQYVLDNGRCAENKVFEALGKPLGHIKEFNEVSLDIFRHNPKYFSMKSVNVTWTEAKYFFYNKTDRTHIFLDNGGFTIIEEEKARESNRERKIKVAEGDKIIKDAKYYWTPHWISGVSAVIAIGALSWSIYSSSDNVTQETFNTRLDSIQTEIEALKTAKEEVVKKTDPAVIDAIKPEANE